MAKHTAEKWADITADIKELHRYKTALRGLNPEGVRGLVEYAELASRLLDEQIEPGERTPQPIADGLRAALAAVKGGES